MNPFKLLISYTLTDTAIQVHTLGGFLLTEVALADIGRVHHGFQVIGLNEYWLNRVDLWHSAVTLQRKHGLIRNLVITPDHPEQFLATVRSLLRRRQG
ncbi:MAG: hypothetical protein H7338_10510 [Candidatus Sericytochromatia bacterium]|nr:hypothetical protein [Candidatus Sericytochromatia bacterium]